MTEYTRRADGICCRCLKMVAISKDGKFCVRCESQSDAPDDHTTSTPQEPDGNCKDIDVVAPSGDVVETTTDATVVDDTPIVSVAVDAVQDSELPGESRLDQLRNWLQEVGPKSRQDVIGQCPIPDNTIKALLSRTNGFEKDDAGLWSVSAESAVEGTVGT